MINNDTEFVKHWQPVYEQFKRVRPSDAEKMIDWYPSGLLEITIRTSDGLKLRYDYVNNTVRTVYSPYIDLSNFDEQKWRKEFAIRLDHRMKYYGVTIDELSYMTGISKVTISKYLNAKSTPSSFNLKQISQALHISSSEFIDLEHF